MSRSICALAALLLLSLAFSMLTKAQTPTPTPTNTSVKTRKPPVAERTEAAALAEQRRTTVISLLAMLADEARSYKDQALRARVLARAADALWKTDEDRARALSSTLIARVLGKRFRK